MTDIQNMAPDAGLETAGDTAAHALRKPSWIRVKAPVSAEYNRTRKLMRELRLNTVCEEAACPNIGECWAQRHATVMILGSVCTRACAFCNVKTGKPDLLDPHEPDHLAEAVGRLGLEHVVITSVDRDDLPDGGAAHFVACIEKIRKTSPGTTIEILTPDFLRKEGAVEAICAAKPDVYNHNLETVPRLYAAVRPGARYFHSLRLLSDVKRKYVHSGCDHEESSATASSGAICSLPLVAGRQLFAAAGRRETARASVPVTAVPADERVRVGMDRTSTHACDDCRRKWNGSHFHPRM